MGRSDEEFQAEGHFIGSRSMCSFVCVFESLSQVQLLVTLCTVARQASLPMEFSRQEYWSGLPFPLPGVLPNPGMETASPTSQAGSLPSEPSGSPI